MSISNEQTPQEMWTTYAPYLKSPLAASAAIVPVYYGFIVKAARQLGRPVSKIALSHVLKSGCEAAPIIGLQVGIQQVIEKPLTEKISGAGSMLASSVVVGALSAPALAAFNGQAIAAATNKPRLPAAINAIRFLSRKQIGAILVRETSFLLAIRISGPLSETMKQKFANNKIVDYGSVFTGGVIASLIGHPADTALTLWQKNMKLENLRMCMRGAPTRAFAIGGFSICNKLILELMNKWENKK